MRIEMLDDDDDEEEGEEKKIRRLSEVITETDEYVVRCQKRSARALSLTEKAFLEAASREEVEGAKSSRVYRRAGRSSPETTVPA